MYKTRESTLFYKYFRIFLIVATYWIISIVTVFVNKTLLSSSTVNLNAPLFLTWFQCVVSTQICFVMNYLSGLFPEIIKLPAGNPLRLDTVRKVLPLSILFTAMIATNNLCLKYVSVPFYYVGRSLTTVFNVSLTYVLLGQKTSLKCISCCAIIVFGFWLGVDQESLSDTFSWKGTLYGVLGSLTLSLYSIYTKIILPRVNQEVWLLSYYNNFYSIFLFAPLIIISGEVDDILKYQNLKETWFWIGMIIGGVCGFSIGFVTALQIKVTSPLTHNVSGTSKACAQTIIATNWYREQKSFLWWTSNILVLLGSASYARIKQLELEDQHHRSIIAQKI